ncbi:MAG: helix-turn-helix domain-containing protein [Saccharofermentans sp.]|nr:helix-turn-helix domain-containing protein [Saccharofermentans sp.]
MLKYFREKEELSQAELASKIGVKPSTIGMYETGERQPNFETEEKIADYFNVSLDVLRGKREYSAQPIILLETIGSKASSVKIPVLGDVAAGIPLNAIENIIDYEEIPEELASQGEFFGLRIKGDSMEPRICDGDVVIVRKQEDADSGDTIIACVNGDYATCKRLVKQSDCIMLVSLNSKYAPMIYTKDDVINMPVTIIGKVVELRGKL